MCLMSYANKYESRLIYIRIFRRFSSEKDASGSTPIRGNLIISVFADYPLRCTSVKTCYKNHRGLNLKAGCKQNQHTNHSKYFIIKVSTLP